MSLIVSKSSSEGVFFDVRDAPRPWKTWEKAGGRHARQSAHTRGGCAPVSAQLSPARASLLFPELNSLSDSTATVLSTGPPAHSLRESTACTSQGPGSRVEARAQSLYLD